MSRKLFLLNALLAALLGAAGWHLRQNWEEAQLRQQAFLDRRVQPAPAPPIPRLDQAAPAPAASYAEVASKMVFSKDRNPNVIVEEAKPKPVPPFPVAYGVMAFGDIATAFLSEAPGKEQKNYRVGEKVGPFKLAALSKDELVLEWEDKVFKKTLEELKPKAPSSSQAQGSGTGGVVTKELPVNLAPMTPPEKFAEIQSQLNKGGPGLDVGGPVRVCAPGDESPAGTVMGGYRKVVGQTPFGRNCRWEPVR